MHRHGYKGRKFGRERDQRQALLRSLIESLVIHGSVVTTMPKAKELRSYTEGLITIAKKANLTHRRQLISELGNKSTVNRLIDEIAPKLAKRQSGYLRIEVAHERRGDNSPLATISFVDDIKVSASAQTAAKPESTTQSKPGEKSTSDKIGNINQASDLTTKTDQSRPQLAAQAPKRTGFRGNR